MCIMENISIVRCRLQGTSIKDNLSLPEQRDVFIDNFYVNRSMVALLRDTITSFFFRRVDITH